MNFGVGWLITLCFHDYPINYDGSDPRWTAPLTQLLDIQSALHQTKRRFTDFVFQRVTIRSDGNPLTDESESSTPPHPAAQRLLRSPRSVSSLQIPNRRAAAAAAQAQASNGVPQVRATSPGAEIRQAQRLAAERKEADEKRQRALQGPPTPQNDSQTAQGDEATNVDQATSSGSSHAPANLSHLQTLRRFQISRSSGSHMSPLNASRGGIKKRRGTGGAPGIAVLVEQLQRKPHSRQASVIADLVHQAQVDSESSSRPQTAEDTEPPAKPRKRPVVNQAEKKWREDRQKDISAAKQHLSDTLEKSAQAHQSTWDEESERLAEEFQRVALEIEHDMELDPENLDERFAPPTSRPHVPITPFHPLKYQPRPPKQPRAVPAQQPPSAVSKPETAAPLPNVDDDNDYVYDVYIRRPLEEVSMLANPLADAEADQQLKNLETPTSGIGVIVITEEDEEYWEHFVEDDEEEWDSEDADSNGQFDCIRRIRCIANPSIPQTAENNPANDYPEEELSCSDEEDDPTAIYRKYRYRAASDDEEYGYDDSENEGQYGAGFNQWRSGAPADSDSD